VVRESYILLFLYVFAVNTNGQDSIRFSGQFSSWANINNGSDFPLWGGVRYIPQLNYSTRAVSVKKFDTELSANIFGSAGLHPFDTLSASGNIKPYRAWVRYSSEQLELRLGLQKINFGSASMLRPLMWFDQIDPRDPLQLTDGVWGFLARYYFLNNANLWLWALYGNSDRKGWEVVPVNKRIPEYGGRIQLPVEKGEIGLSYHHRVADSRELGSEFNSYDKIPENRIGFDAKWDLKTGIWLEGSYTNKRRDIGIYTNQFAVNAGIDYTFSVGNGLYMAFEQLLAAYDEKPFSFSNNIIYSLLMFNYPIGLFDRLSAIIYYNWSEETVYNFINWQKQFDKIILYVMAYWNPESLQLPAQSDAKNIFAGKGIQLMFVFNH
jgi:hypothetical protein